MRENEKSQVESNNKGIIPIPSKPKNKNQTTENERKS